MLKRTTYGISHMLYPKRDGDYSIVLSATLSSARDITVPIFETKACI